MDNNDAQATPNKTSGILEWLQLTVSGEGVDPGAIKIHTNEVFKVTARIRAQGVDGTPYTLQDEELASYKPVVPPFDDPTNRGVTIISQRFELETQPGASPFHIITFEISLPKEGTYQLAIAGTVNKAGEGSLVYDSSKLTLPPGGAVSKLDQASNSSIIVMVEESGDGLPPQKPKFSYLEWLQICAGENDADQVKTPVFRNGKQQAHIKIKLRARNESDELYLFTDKELETIDIIDYNTGKTLTSQVSTEKNQFDYYSDYTRLVEGLGAESVAGAAPGTQPDANDLQVVERWITTDSPNELKIAAQLRVFDAGSLIKTITSNTSTVPGGGAGKDGRFNSSVIIVPKAPIAHRADEFEVSRENIDATGAPYEPDVDLFHIKFRDPNLKIRGSEHVPASAKDEHFYYEHRRSENRHQIAHTFTPQPVAYHFATGGWHQADYTVNTRKDNACVSRVIPKPDTYQASGQIWKATQMIYFDQFGNPNPIWINPFDWGNDLTLGDTEKKFDPPPT